jgi:hypothetical protein
LTQQQNGGQQACNLVVACLVQCSPVYVTQTVSKRVANAKNRTFHQNVHKRGAVETESKVMCQLRR